MIYSNFFRSKIDNFQRKIVDIFLSFAQNIDCGYLLEPPRRGGSNVYPQSMFWSKNKKNRYTPAYPSYAIKSGVWGYTFHGHVFMMRSSRLVTCLCSSVCSLALYVARVTRLRISDNSLGDTCLNP